VARLIEAIYEHPRCGAVYNLGGGRANSCSILEAFDIVAQLTGKKMDAEHQEGNREGDHICYITNLHRVQQDYPGWAITKTLDDIFVEMVASWQERSHA
jgi:CDP-paratose 2-epimerase